MTKLGDTLSPVGLRWRTVISVASIWIKVTK
jgi:hypothetical protein